MQQTMQLLHCMLQSPSKRMVSSTHSKQLAGWQHTWAAYKTMKGLQQGRIALQQAQQVAVGVRTGRHTWLTAGLILAMGRMLDSIFSGLKLLTPMLLISPSSTHFSRAAQVSSKGGSTFGPGFTDVGLLGSDIDWAGMAKQSHNKEWHRPLLEREKQLLIRQEIRWWQELMQNTACEVQRLMVKSRVVLCPEARWKSWCMLCPWGDVAMSSPVDEVKVQVLQLQSGQTVHEAWPDLITRVVLCP